MASEWTILWKKLLSGGRLEQAARERGDCGPETEQMRIVVGGLYHETNTFASACTDLQAFKEYQYAEGDEILEKYRGTRMEIGAFLDYAEPMRWEVIPTIYAAALPAGIVKRRAYNTLIKRILRRIRLPANGALFALHGAMVAEGIEDCEADVLKCLREVLGAGCPIVATFDIHANLSREIVEYADTLVGYDTYPHTDIYERGLEAGRILGELVQKRSRPAKSFRKLPLLTAPQAQATDSSPMKDVMAKVHEWEASGQILCASVAVGFPYADVGRVGASILAYALGSEAIVQSCTSDIAGYMWEVRRSFSVNNISAEEAVHRALSVDEGPVVLVDVADNTGGGAPGDGTVLLRALLTAGASNCVVTIVDAEAVQRAAVEGVDSEVDLLVGGKHDRHHGEPVQIKGRVVKVTDGGYVHRGSYMTGLKVGMGKTAIINCGGLNLVLTERKAMPFDAEQLRSVGIEPAQQRIIVVKSAIAWKAAYGDIAKEAIYVETPGICSSNLQRFMYKAIPRPIFPLDEI